MKLRFWDLNSVNSPTFYWSKQEKDSLNRRLGKEESPLVGRYSKEFVAVFNLPHMDYHLILQDPYHMLS